MPKSKTVFIATKRNTHLTECRIEEAKTGLSSMYAECRRFSVTSKLGSTTTGRNRWHVFSDGASDPFAVVETLTQAKAEARKHLQRIWERRFGGN